MSEVNSKDQANKLIGLIGLHLSRATMSMYATHAECKAARDSLIRLRDELERDNKDVNDQIHGD